MDYDVIIVGAGASGLVAAITAAEKGASVLVIEQKEKAGKKILATGNGKCNFTNMHQSPDCYRSNDGAFAMKVLSKFDNISTVKFFEKLGIVPKERDGYVYPNSEQAASVVNVLLMECERLNVQIVCNEKVIRVTEPDFTVHAQRQDDSVSTYFGRKLVLAAGGCASPKLGSDGSGYALAKAFGHTVIKPLPALVPLKSQDRFCRTLSGVRTLAKVALYIDNGFAACEEGEIIFTDYGISGIPVMQVSRFAARALDEGKTVHLSLDFTTGISVDELALMLTERCIASPHKTMEQMMVGMFNSKLNYVVIREAGLNPELSCRAARKPDIDKLAKRIKNFTVRINGTNTFDFAQAASGGVSTAEVDASSMESKIRNGLYITGELLDVDGTCGGYNLQWAWSTGHIAGSHAGGTAKTKEK